MCPVVIAEHPLALVLDSTVPVGTNQKVSEVVVGGKHPTRVVSHPELLEEGAAVDDAPRAQSSMIRKDRCVAGATQVAIASCLLLGANGLTRHCCAPHCDVSADQARSWPASSAVICAGVS